ncbi:MAG TPA: tetratricopeptide repeat protein, partial [Streptosporangiaceae bacterium]|nr:tetratricopeptide repeat protein [Streptosporangiaceae bacterium]
TCSPSCCRPRAHLWPRPPDTLVTRDRVACWTGRAGDAAAARVMLADLLPVRERVLGPEHLDTLATHHNLAYWTECAVSQAVASDRCLI